jgi:hypothetical protein
MTPEKFRKMSTARLQQVMANGVMVRDRKMATQEYYRRFDKKSAMGKSVQKSNGISVHIEIQGMVDKTAAELKRVLERALTETLSQIMTPRP